MEFGGAGQLIGKRAQNETLAGSSEQQSQGSARYRQQCRFGQNGAKDLGGASAQRGSNRELLTSRNSSGEDQVGCICAGDEQHEADRTEQDQQGGSNLSDQRVLEGGNHGAPAFVLLRILPREPVRDHVHLRLRFRHGHAGPQARDDEKVVVATYSGLLGSPGEGHPGVGCGGEPGLQQEFAGHHADHAAAVPVQFDHAAHGVAGRSEIAFCKAMAQDYDVIATGLAFVGGEGTSQRGLNLKHGEEAGFCGCGGNGKRPASPAQAKPAEADDCH